MIRIISAAIASIITFALLLIAVFKPLNQQGQERVELAAKVQQAIPEAGIEHPITAVLLNFRSYDTLLEVAVLLVAVIIGLGLRPVEEQQSKQLTAMQNYGDAPMLNGFVRRLLPILLLTAIYILWAGSTMPGGAFQAGALIAACGVIARLAGYDIASRVNSLLKFGLVLGFLVFLIVAISTMFGGRPFLNYPEGWAGSLIFFIEAMLTFSIGLTLLSLFVHAPSETADSEAADSEAKGAGGRND